MAPEAPFKLSPVGKLPEDTVYVIEPVPPVVDTVWL